MSFEPCRHHTATFALAAAAALAFMTAPSMAASASASLTNISLSVEDLDLTDGITAGFSFVQGASTVQAIFSVNIGPISDQQDLSQSGLNSPFIPVSASVSVTGAQASGVAAPNSLKVSGSTSAPDTAFFGQLLLATGSVFQVRDIGSALDATHPDDRRRGLQRLGYSARRLWRLLLRRWQRRCGHQRPRRFRAHAGSPRQGFRGSWRRCHEYRPGKRLVPAAARQRRRRHRQSATWVPGRRKWPWRGGSRTRNLCADARRPRGARPDLAPAQQARSFLARHDASAERCPPQCSDRGGTAGGTSRSRRSGGPVSVPVAADLPDDAPARKLGNTGLRGQFRCPTHQTRSGA